MKTSLRFVAACALAASWAGNAGAQAVIVDDEELVGPGRGGFGGTLAEGDFFGWSVAPVGDLDGDGIVELAVGAPGDEQAGHDQGAVWILWMQADGTVRAERKLLPPPGHLTGLFGYALAALGDPDGDGIRDLAVGARDAVWTLRLDAEGAIAGARELLATDVGASTGVAFGDSVACAGDVDGDGIDDLVVGAPETDAGGDMQGAVWILFLAADGSVHAAREISATSGGFGGDLDPVDLFGSAVASPGDLDGDGRSELAVGARWDDDGGSNRGAVWMLFLAADGSVRSQQKISETQGGFTGNLGQFGSFGSACGALGDLDRDGFGDLGVGAPEDTTIGAGNGALWLLHLGPDGRVRAQQRIDATTGGFDPHNNYLGRFAGAVTDLGDPDDDGVTDLAVGAGTSFDGIGGVWILRLGACMRLDFATEDDLATPLVNGQHLDVEFGRFATLTSAGPNAGLAVFDSTPGGPNDPSQDPDLLVGTGNLIVLQTENYPPDANDVFPRPNDDEDGGTIAFDFATTVELASVRVVDLDAADGAAALVLADVAGRTRTYVLPPDWTGDRMLGAPGHRVLDLTSLVPQPGHGSTATASDDFGFEPGRVVRLEIRLDGSGALDDLVFSPAGASLAAAAVRVGAVGPATRLTSAAPPVLGQTWRGELDCVAFGAGVATLVVASRAESGVWTALGERLVGGEVLHREAHPFAATPTPLAISVPADPALLGVEVHLQGACRSALPITHGRVRSAGGLSNAVDLRFGF